MPTARLRVRVQPGAKASQIVGLAEGVLRLRIAAPPVEGKANKAVEELLAAALDVPKSRVRLVRGTSSRDKVVEVDGLSEEEVLKRLSQGSGAP